MAVLGKGNVSDNGFPLPNFEPMPANWAFPDDRYGHKQPFPAGGDGWYIQLPTSETGDVFLYNDANVVQWNYVVWSGFDPLFTTNSRWVAFYYDHTDELLYCVVSRVNASPSPMYLMSINAAGTVDRIGADVGTVGFATSSDFTTTGGWGGTAFDGATLYRQGGDGVGAFTLLAGVNDALTNVEYVTINASDGTWTEANPTDVYLSTHDDTDKKASYFNSNDIGMSVTNDSTGLQVMHFVDKSTGVVRDVHTGSYLWPWWSTVWSNGMAIQPWGGYMAFIHDTNAKLAGNGSVYGLSQTNFDIWLNRMAVFLGMRTGI